MAQPIWDMKGLNPFLPIIPAMNFVKATGENPVIVAPTLPGREEPPLSFKKHPTFSCLVVHWQWTSNCCTRIKISTQ